MEGDFSLLAISRADRQGITLRLSPGSEAKLRLINPMGVVVDQRQISGSESELYLEWNRPVGEGIWFAQLQQGSLQQVMRLVL